MGQISIQGQEDVDWKHGLGGMSKQVYPSLFDNARTYGQSGSLKKLKVCHKETNWKTRPEDIPCCNNRVTYNVEEVSDNEAMQFVRL